MYTSDLKLLAAAGGGGGACRVDNRNNEYGKGQSSESGASNQCGSPDSKGGVNGHGATKSVTNSAAGGAGWLSDGHEATRGGHEGKSRVGNWIGGREAGFGGGGGSFHGGGGGGYSGGAGGVWCSGVCGGGGGGSYCRTSANCKKESGGSPSPDGRVIITGPVGNSC